MNLVDEFKGRSFTGDLIRLYRCLSSRRKFQLALLFILQSVSAVSEVVSLGAVIPFLSALTNIDALMQNAKMQVVLSWTGITSSDDLIILIAGLFAAAIIVANALRFFTLWAQYQLSALIGTDMSRMMFEKTLFQPYGFFLRTNSSDLIGNATNDLSGTLGVIQNIFMIVTQGLITFAISTSLLFYDPVVALALSGITVVAFSLIMIIIKKRLLANGAIISDSYRASIKALQEGFGGIRFILLHKTQRNFIDQYAQSDRDYRQKSSENGVIRQAPRFFIEAIGVSAISLLAMVFIMQKKDINQVIPLLGFLALGCYRLLPAVQQVYSAVTALIGLKKSLHRTMEMLGRTIPAAVLLEPKTPLNLRKELRFNDVCFSYKGLEASHTDDWALKNITMSFPARGTIALVGSTGSGKSTLADLILGLNAPSKGTISVDGQVLTAENINAWQKSIAHVPQNIYLTDNSIAENIAFGVPEAEIDMQKVVAAAKHAQIDDFIESLPQKYRHVVGERGARISGGQLQRIGIARALYHNPSTIVFDEATSALDNKTEKEVMDAITGLGKDMTVILIAHRLSTVKNADRIFLLDHGRIVAEGNYATLLATSAHFQKLVAESGNQASAA